MEELNRAKHYRPNNVAEPKSIVDGAMQRNALNALNQPMNRPPKQSSSKSEELDLVSSMAKRLSALENQVRESGQKMQRLQVENNALKAKLKVTEEEIQKSRAQPTSSSPHSDHARSEASRLRAQLRYAWKQVAELKSFLGDYGLIWVGDPNEPEPCADDLLSPTASSSLFAPPDLQREGSQSLDTQPSHPLPPRPPGGDKPSQGPLGPAAPRRRVSNTSESGLTGPSPSSSFITPQHNPVGPPLPSRSGSFSSGFSLLPPMAPHSSLTNLNPGGSSSDPSSLSNSPKGKSGMPPSGLKPSASLPFPMARLMEAVDDLNQRAGDGCGQLVGGGRRGGAVSLHTPEPVRLTLYRDGLQVHRSPPRPYDDPAGLGVLRDIIDGYFPLVLKSEFPDGVPLKVVDRTLEAMSASSHGSALPGQGRGNVRSFNDLESAGPLSKQEFLNRLPQTIIKNGKVIAVRSEVGKIVGDSSSEVKDAQLVSTPTDALLSTLQRNHAGPLLPPPPPTRGGPDGRPASGASSRGKEITTLQVKSEDGGQTFILKLQYDDTIWNLRQCINEHRGKLTKEQGKAEHGPYEIRSAFPARAYNAAKETLREAGLIPNATLFLKSLNH